MREGGRREELIEVTSSGMTHTCADSRINSFLCPLMMSLFSSHRLSPLSYYIGKNFGLITVIDGEKGENERNSNFCEKNSICEEEKIDISNSDDDAKILKISIQTIDGLGSRRNYTPSDNFETQETISYKLKLPNHGKQNDFGKVVDFYYADFYSVPAPVSIAIIIFLFLILRRLLSK